MAAKYYWLKLHKDFFGLREIKKLRTLEKGDTYTIIYLKLQLLSITNDGLLTYYGTEDDLSSQLALELDEEKADVETTLSFLQANACLEQLSQTDYLLLKVPKSIGTESTSAQRVRKHREAMKALQNPPLVTPCNTEIEKEIETELKIEKEFTPPTLQEVQAYCTKRNNHINAKLFLQDYIKEDLHIRNDWKAALRSYEKRNELGFQTTDSKSGSTASQAKASSYGNVL